MRRGRRRISRKLMSRVRMRKISTRAENKSVIKRMSRGKGSKKTQI
jgi:hypothetical protein